MEATALVHAHPSDSFEGRSTNLLLFSYSCSSFWPAVPTPETFSYWFDIQFSPPFLNWTVQPFFKLDREEWFGLTGNADALRDEIKVVGQGLLISFARCICCEREKGAEQVFNVKDVLSVNF